MIDLQLFIEDTLVDVKDPQVADLNYTINDIQNPEARQTDFTYGIVLPGTPTNDVLLGNIFRVNSYITNASTTNFTPDFNPNLKAKAKIFISGVIVFDGIIEMRDINITDNNQVEYNVTLYGKLVNIFKNIGDKFLSDLDLSRFDHPYTWEKIDNSMRYDTIVINGVDTAFVQGIGYQYGLIDWGYSYDLVNYPIESFKPLIFAQTIWEQIISDADFIVDSTWLDTVPFGKFLVTPVATTVKIDNANVNDYLYLANMTSDFSFSNPTILTSQIETIIMDNDSVAPAFDTSGQYSTVTGEFEVGTSLASKRTFVGKFYFQVDLTITDGTYTGTPVNADGHIELIMLGVKYTAATATWATVYANTGRIRYDVNTFATSYSTDVPGALYSAGGEFDGSMWNSSEACLCTVVIPDLLMTDGDKLIFQVRHRATALTFGGFTGTTQIKVLTDSSDYCVLSDAVIVEGGTMNINSCLSKTIKQKDFIMSIVKMFNLYIDYDKDNTNTLLIEPRDTYYTSSVVNWERKVDYSKPVVKKPMGALDAKVYNWRYKPDNDYYNKLYFDEFKEPYGSRRVEVNNEFVKNEKNIEVIFSPTPLVGNDLVDRIIPRIIQYDGTTVKTFDANIRILYNAGAKNTSPWNVVYDYGASVQSYSTYPLIAHLDDVYDPTFDLNFGMPKRIYYDNRFNPINYTDNNTYNIYHKTGIDEITDRNSAIYEYYMFLEPKDIAELDFRKLYFLDNAYFRLNSINGFNPLTDNTVKCTFLKLQVANAFTPTTFELNGALIEGDTEIAPVFNNTTLQNRPVANLSGQTKSVSGSGNLVMSNDNIFVLGNNNVIGANTRNVTVFGDNVVVHPDVTDVVVYNSSGVTFEVTESGMTYTDGESNSGTYRPTLTSVANVTTSTGYDANYMRVGNTVTVSGKVDITPTVNGTNTQLGISLPIASNIGATEDCAGTASVPGATPVIGVVRGDSTNDRAEILFVSTGTTSKTFYFTFTYQVI